MSEDYIEIFHGAVPKDEKIYSRYPGSSGWYWRVVDGGNSSIKAIGGEKYYSASNAKRAAMKLFPYLQVNRV